MHSYDIISEPRQGVTVYDLLVDKSGKDYKGSAIGCAQKQLLNTYCTWRDTRRDADTISGIASCHRYVGFVCFLHHDKGIDVQRIYLVHNKMFLYVYSWKV